MDKRDATAPNGDEAEGLYGADLGRDAIVGNYVIEELRSRGGFATVYRARHLKLERQVALKVLHRYLSGSSKMVARFRQEAQAANRIRHANIVDVHEFGELADGRPYFVMEWLAGFDLDEYLDEHGPLGVDEALGIMEDLGDALSAAHRAGIVHRDVKPSNVVLVPAGGSYHVKLVDFGVAKLLDSEEMPSTGLTSSNVRIGTPTNMAPEQILCHPVDARTDVYALGVLLYRMLTAESPFRGDSPLEIEDQHLNSPPPRVSDRVPVPLVFDAVIQRCMAKQPEHRFQTVDEMLHHLRRGTMSAKQNVPGIRSCEGLAIYVEIAFRQQPEEELLNQIDDTLSVARAAMIEEGFQLIADTSATLAGVCLLPADGDENQRLRSRTIDMALRARKSFAGDERFGALIALHAGPVMARDDGERQHFVGGELLQLSSWIGTSPAGTVSANERVLEGVKGRYQTEPSSNSDRAVILGVRS